MPAAGVDIDARETRMSDMGEPGTVRVAAHEAKRAPGVTLYLCGDFDRDNCEHIATAVRDVLAAGHRTIVLDVQQVGFIDAATAGTMLSCHASDAGGTAAIINAADNVASVLNVIATSQCDRSGVSLVSGSDDRASSGGLCRALSASPSYAAEVVATSAMLIERAHALMAETRRIRATVRPLIAGPADARR